MSDGKPTIILGGTPYEFNEDIPQEMGDAIVTETANEYWRSFDAYKHGLLSPKEWRLRATELTLGLAMMAATFGPYLTVGRRVLRAMGILVGHAMGIFVSTEFA